MRDFKPESVSWCGIPVGQLTHKECEDFIDWLLVRVDLLANLHPADAHIIGLIPNGNTQAAKEEDILKAKQERAFNTLLAEGNEVR